jgi:hypothetical protein
MKKVLFIGLCGLLVLSSCGTATGTGAYVGGQFGHVIGSAIGGITGGRHGHDVGSLIGTVGGVAAGAAVGAAVDHAQQNRFEKEMAQRRQLDDSGYNAQGRGDDRIDFETSYMERESESLLIRNVHVVDGDQDAVLVRNEECRISFEIMNYSDKPVHNVQPIVMEVTGNKHVQISPNLNIERIRPGEGVRYSATILADGRLKDGEVKIKIGVSKHAREIASQNQVLTIQTRKKK